MVTYIKHDVKGFFVELPEVLNSKLYDNIGTTWDDFIDNKWVILSSSLIQFKLDNPLAKVHEVWNMELDPVHVRTLEDAKIEMISKIDLYDQSSEVNGFTINNSIEAWFTPEERSNYRSSISAALLLSVETLSFYVGDIMLQVTPDVANTLLALILLYADACFIVTKQHKKAVELLELIEEVDNYDYKTGYPEKINVTL